MNVSLLPNEYLSVESIIGARHVTTEMPQNKNIARYFMIMIHIARQRNLTHTFLTELIYAFRAQSLDFDFVQALLSRKGKPKLQSAYGRATTTLQLYACYSYLRFSLYDVR